MWAEKLFLQDVESSYSPGSNTVLFLEAEFSLTIIMDCDKNFMLEKFFTCIHVNNFPLYNEIKITVLKPFEIPSVCNSDFRQRKKLYNGEKYVGFFMKTEMFSRQLKTFFSYRQLMLT